MWNPTSAATGGSGPLLLMIDNGWASARDWALRTRVAEDRIDAAERAGRSVALFATADPPADISLGAPGAAREKLRALLPQPWTPDSAANLPALQAFLAAPADSIAYRKNLERIKQQLVAKHRFTLSADDLSSITYVYDAFFGAGNSHACRTVGACSRSGGRGRDRAVTDSITGSITAADIPGSGATGAAGHGTASSHRRASGPSPVAA